MTVLQPMAEPRRRGLSGAVAGSVILHLGLIGAAWLALHWARPLKLGPSVAITLVASGPANLRQAQQAPEEVEAATPAPAPEATPAPVAPPAPVPPVPSPAKALAPKAAAPPPKAPSPTPKPPTPAKPGLDLDALAAQLSARAGAGRVASSAARGPARAATAMQATPAVGPATGVSASALRGLSDELNRRWNPNCMVEGGQDVNVKVTLRLGPGGRLIGTPTSTGETSADTIVKAASDRAIRAVVEAAPFDTLPPELFGQTYSVNFDARKACAA
ncbi:MAG: hypothetical protein JWM33_2079 [Caulobacteraceae bacterium]|nr:hypothetical protein [Caulobacteraceae bacterium]